MKKLVTDQAFQVVDMAVEIAGGFGVSRHSEIERLFRDARMGKIHPANSFLTRELISKLILGLDFDAAPRWG
jgi:alkylation response protein AidB-like acyl-CoA dehydrogenase